MSIPGVAYMLSQAVTYPWAISPLLGTDHLYWMKKFCYFVRIDFYNFIIYKHFSIII
jgi:hypothetical protein